MTTDSSQHPVQKALGEVFAGNLRIAVLLVLVASHVEPLAEELLVLEGRGDAVNEALASEGPRPSESATPSRAAVRKAAVDLSAVLVGLDVLRDDFLAFMDVDFVDVVNDGRLDELKNLRRSLLLEVLLREKPFGIIDDVSENRTHLFLEHVVGVLVWEVAFDVLGKERLQSQEDGFLGGLGTASNNSG